MRSLEAGYAGCVVPDQCSRSVPASTCARRVLPVGGAKLEEQAQGYVRKNEHADARYEVVAHEAAIVTELFRRYVEDGVAIAELARWLSATGVATRTGKPRWDRSVIWGMLRNPPYAGRACFGKTMRTADQPGLNRTARLEGRATPRSYSVTDRPTQDWLEIPVPALVTEDTWARVQRSRSSSREISSSYRSCSA